VLEIFRGRTRQDEATQLAIRNTKPQYQRMSGDQLMSDMNSMFMNMMGAAMSDMGFGGSPSMCSEGDWRSLPAGPIFLATRDLDVDRLDVLLQQDEYAEMINDKDGDGCHALTQLSFSKKSDEDDIFEIVRLFKEAGANLDFRGPAMMARETPLHIAATYGKFAVVKALVDAGATPDIKDDRGRLPVDNARKSTKKSPGLILVKKDDGQKCIDYLENAVLNKGTGGVKSKHPEQLRRAKVIRELADRYYRSGYWDLAAKTYKQLLEVIGDDHVVYGNIAAAHLMDATERILSDNTPGYRQLFKDTFFEAEKCVDLCETYERGWYLMARGYIGYRELPRAKEAARKGLVHCPDSKSLSAIWAIMDEASVPDSVVDHESAEWRAISQRIYMERWIGEEACTFCGLSCMDSPKPELCPFCGCPTSIDLNSTDEGDAIICLTADVDYQPLIDALVAAETESGSSLQNKASFSVGSGGSKKKGSSSSKKKRGKKKRKN